MSMHKHVFHNDRVLPLEQVRLSPGQAGLLNGWGIFMLSLPKWRDSLSPGWPDIHLNANCC
jgi:hypothetical protein